MHLIRWVENEEKNDWKKDDWIIIIILKNGILV